MTSQRDRQPGQPSVDRREDVDPDVAQLLGLRPTDAESMPDSAELESPEANGARAGETGNPDVAAEEGLVWIPPMDPPTRPDADGFGPEVAAGFGTTASDEPFDADHHGEPLYAADERTERVIEALRADARTSGFADRLSVDSDGGQVFLEGRVDDLDDEDAAIAVAEEVAGVMEVVSRLAIGVLEPDRTT